MNLWGAAGWGLLGGLCVEALALLSQIRSNPEWNWRKPIPQGLVVYLISIVLRAGVGAGVAAAAAGSHTVSGTLAVFGLGVGAPLVVEKLARAVPLTETWNLDAGHQVRDRNAGASVETTPRQETSDHPEIVLNALRTEPSGVTDAR